MVLSGVGIIGRVNESKLLEGGAHSKGFGVPNFTGPLLARQSVLGYDVAVVSYKIALQC